MKTQNPRVFLREGELYAFVEEVPILPKGLNTLDDAIKLAKASAIKVKNQEDAMQFILKPIRVKLAKNKQVSEAYIASYGIDNDQLKSDTIYTLEGYQMEVEGENHPDCGTDARGCSMPCHSVCEKMEEPHRLVAIISPVVEPEKFDPNLPCGPKKQEPNTERLIDKVGKAKRVIRDAEGKAIGFEPFIKEPPVVEHKQEEVDKPRCECELFLEKYYGFSSQSLTERSKINTDYGDLVNLLAMFREELKQQPTEWIPVSERLPEETQPVLWCRSPVEEPYTVASMLDVGFDYTYYTHWQPLPQPPKI
jgi:hypothetical protein